MRELVGKVRKGRPEKKSGIYQISCGGCPKIYVGQTWRRLDTRDREHDSAIRLRHPEKSAVAEHCISNGHRKGEIKLMQEVGKHWHLNAWESLFIGSHPPEQLIKIKEQPIISSLFKYACKYEE